MGDHFLPATPPRAPLSHTSIIPQAPCPPSQLHLLSIYSVFIIFLLPESVSSVGAGMYATGCLALPHPYPFPRTVPAWHPGAQRGSPSFHLRLLSVQ